MLEITPTLISSVMPKCFVHVPHTRIRVPRSLSSERWSKNDDPSAAIFAALFISYIQVGGAAMQPAYSSETIDIVIAVIIYLAAFALLMRGVIAKAVSGRKEKGGAAK